MTSGSNSGLSGVRPYAPEHAVDLGQDQVRPLETHVGHHQLVQEVPGQGRVEVRRDHAVEVAFEVDLGQHVGVQQAGDLLPRASPRGQVGRLAEPRIAAVRVPVREQHREVLGPAEDRIATLAVEHPVGLTGHRLRQREVPDGHRVTDRFVEVPDHPPQPGDEIPARHLDLVVIGARGAGDAGGVFELVGVLRTEVQGERGEGRAAVLAPGVGRDHRDDGGIEAAREERADGDVIGEPLPHRGVDGRAGRRDEGLGRSVLRLDVLVHEPPRQLVRSRPQVDGEVVTGLQLVEALQRGALARDEAEREELRDRSRIEPAGHTGGREHALRLDGEHRAPGVLRPVDGAGSRGIAGDDEAVARADDDDPLAGHMAERARAPATNPTQDVGGTLPAGQAATERHRQLPVLGTRDPAQLGDRPGAGDGDRRPRRGIGGGLAAATVRERRSHARRQEGVRRTGEAPERRHRRLTRSRRRRTTVRPRGRARRGTRRRRWPIRPRW